MSECARVGRDTQTLGMHVRCYCRTVIQGRRPASEGPHQNPSLVTLEPHPSFWSPVSALRTGPQQQTSARVCAVQTGDTGRCALAAVRYSRHDGDVLFTLWRCLCDL